MVMFLSDGMTVGAAALYALIGFVVVLLVLALLVGIFYLSGFIFKSELFGRKKPAPHSPEPETPSADADTDAETVAAITAAVALMLEQEDGCPDFVIRRVTRKNSK